MYGDNEYKNNDFDNNEYKPSEPVNPEPEIKQETTSFEVLRADAVEEPKAHENDQPRQESPSYDNRPYQQNNLGSGVEYGNNTGSYQQNRYGSGRYSSQGRYSNDSQRYSYGNYNIPNRNEDNNVGRESDPYGNYRKTEGFGANNGRKKAGFFPKAIAAIFLGLFFGAFAAAGFYGVQSLMKMTGAMPGSIISSAPSENTAPEAPESKAALPPAGDSAQAVPAANYSAVVTDVSSVVDSAMPSMVSITNKYTERQNFFGRTFESEGEAGGSGIIIGENDTEYLVVTNQHVIDSANNLLVKFIDQEEIKAHVKGYDADKDIAVIAVLKSDVKDSTKSSIAVANMGDSDALSLGEPTIAIGNALGYGQSVTTGVVSALDRGIADDGGETFIQTDAAINPGNSGGALLNIKGEVIGINSNKLGGSIIEGMGYAIPISRVKPLIEDFMTRSTRGEKVSDDKKAFLGITGVDVTTDVSKTYNMPMGVYVAQVHEGSAADTAGVEMGDILTKFDGSSIKSMNELQDMLSYYEAGTEVEITVQRGTPGGYQEKSMKVVLGFRSEMENTN